MKVKYLAFNLLNNRHFILIYSNLIYLLLVMAILATGAAPEKPFLPGYLFLALFLVKIWFFRRIIRIYRSRKTINKVTDYFSVERNLAVSALLFFGVDVYLLDLNYFLDLLPLAGLFPSLVYLAGFAVFLAYLVVVWSGLKPDYEEVVGVRKDAFEHVKDKLRICIALVLPWLIVNFIHDLLLLVPVEEVRFFLASPWGEPLFLLAMVVVAVIWFPILLVRLFGCTAIPEGELRRRINKFCSRQGISFAEICFWPIVEGKVLTAGVVGFLGRYRYLMITPALVQSLSDEELEAVVSHEIGHVKNHHLLLYVILFIGFALLIQLCIQPLIALLLTSGLFYDLLAGYEGGPMGFLAFIAGGPLVVITLLYFRYIFGYFMRNFERQADNYSFRVMGRVEPLIGVFRKIALMSGRSRDVPCWHHFSIGQRIENLLRCERNPLLLRSHNHKLHISLVSYFVTIGALLFFTLQTGNLLTVGSEGRFIAEEVILEKIERDSNNPLWHQFHGDLLVAKEQHEKAIKAFERSLELFPDNPEALNNLAWLLLTVEDEKMHDPERALALAQKAAKLRERSHILDTLAEAYWQNGMTELAYEIGRRALENSTANREYYKKQLEKFESGGRS